MCMRRHLMTLTMLSGLAALASPAAAAVPDLVNAINSASIADVPAKLGAPAATVSYGPPTAASKGWPVMMPTASLPSPAVTRLEIMLDQAGASPGVIDGFDGENLRKAIAAFEIMQGGKPDGILGPEIIAALGQPGAVIGSYVIAPDDVAAIGPPTPRDYGAMAQLKVLGYASVAEELAERFHMDEGFLKTLNPDTHFAAGETIYAAVTGPDRQGAVSRIEADKTTRQVRAYDADGKLLAAYPATIGSTATPSPSGTHTVLAVVHNPTYTYNPNVNFKQGDNDKVLTIPPGPNGPVGSTWIDLSEPTFGIHGTPEPSLIDKTASHGCVRLTNWDAAELAGMVSKGVTVQFLP
jgi:lipoprotein-anchoring transpeptidase ErfK/SrfK